jgi:hypothetical protein
LAAASIDDDIGAPSRQRQRDRAAIASKASDDRWTAAKNVIRSDSAIRAGVTDL